VVVVYLNGLEIFRDNMRPGPISFNTLALTRSLGRREAGFLQATLDPGCWRRRQRAGGGDPSERGDQHRHQLRPELTGNTENSLPTRGQSPFRTPQQRFFTDPGQQSLITAAASDTDGTIGLVRVFWPRAAPS